MTASLTVSGTKTSIFELNRLPFAVYFVLALVTSASTWVYVARVMKPQQIADAALHRRPRGNLSDLYPRWLGSRELLLHRRNPYGPQITREIQQGYYGRALDPALPDDPKDQQGFAYPVYVAFLLGPTVHMPFEIVQLGFRWLLFGLAAAMVPLCLFILKWKLPTGWNAILIIAVLGWLPAVQGIKLQQLTLLVAALIAAGVACVARRWLLSAGALLALATIKPQLAWPAVLWLLVWAASDWRSRRKFIIAFAFITMLLIAGAEFLLPGWLFSFIRAISQYHQYTQNQSVLVWMFGSMFGRATEVLSVLACGSYLWRVRRQPASAAEFGTSFALVMALTVVVVPMFAPYNQVLLLPAILTLARSMTVQAEPVLPAVRLAFIIGGLLLVWPWVATLLLSAASAWLTPALRTALWPMPFYSNFITPIFIFGLGMLHTWMTGINDIGLRPNAAAE